ncbi:MAG: heavy-metal-associated domain-containing protein [Bacteroidota bacterium]|nr:heavy-metal-associated domain-containing protein [Bacteroidota bacterium]
MKRCIAKLILICIFIIAQISAHAQFVKAELVASGLTCSMCSFATQKQLQSVPFIDTIGTDLNHTTFLLSFKKDSVIDFTLIKKKVEDAGFSVASLVLTFHFDSLKVDNNYHLYYQNSLYHFINLKSRILNGNTKLKLIDKGFVSDKEYKKYRKVIDNHTSEQAGNTRIITHVYHIIVL